MIGTFRNKNLCHGDKAYDFTPKWPLASDRRAWLGQLRITDIIEIYGNETWYRDLIIDEKLNLFYDAGEQCSGGPLELIGNCEALGSLGALCQEDTLLSVLPEILKAIKGRFSDKARDEVRKKYDREVKAGLLEGIQERRAERLSRIAALPTDAVSVLRGMHLIKGAIESNKELYVYRGIWQPISDSEVEIYLDAIANGLGSDKGSSKDIKNTMDALRRDSRNSLSLRRLYPMYASDADKPKDYFIVDRAGKTLDLLEAIHKAGYDVEPEFRPDLYLTARIAARYKKGVSTRPIEDFLNEVCAHPEEDVPVLQEWLGYNLLARQFPIHKALFLVGDGRGGRSTFYGALERMLGSWNVSHISINGMGERFGLAGMLGKMANIIADMDSLPLQGTHVFKSITGEDPVRIERKGLKDIDDAFLPIKIGIGCNKLPPAIYDRTPGFFARPMIIELPYYFSDEQKEAEDPARWKKRVAERVDDLVTYQGAGILNYAIEGLGRLLDEMKFSYKYSGIANIERYDRLAAPEDELEEFVEEKCIRDRPGSNIAQWTPKMKLYDAYKAWAKGRGTEPITITAFSQGLHRLDITLRRGSRSYKGVALKSS